MPVSEGSKDSVSAVPVPDRAAAPPPPGDAVLVVMARAPRPGEVKTRLVPPLRPEDAAALHRCCVLDTLEKVSRLDGVDIALAYWPPDAGAEFDGLWSGGGEGGGLRFPQAGRDLGERMLTCFRRAFDAGYRCAALHGTDIPLASAGELARGFKRLRHDSADLVLGPTDDGGYYFIGARAVHPELFEGIRWSAPEVLESTRRRAEALGLRTAEIARARDLDTPEDLRALRDAFARPGFLKGKTSFHPHPAPRTREFLMNLPGEIR